MHNIKEGKPREPRNYEKEDADLIFQRYQYVHGLDPINSLSIFSMLYGRIQGLLGSPHAKERYAARVFIERVDDILKQIDPEKNTRAVVTNSGNYTPVINLKAPHEGSPGEIPNNQALGAGVRALRLEADGLPDLPF